MIPQTTIVTFGEIMGRLNPPGYLCLAHSIEGDFNFSSRAEVESLMGGSASGRVVR